MPKRPCITTNCPGFATNGTRCKGCQSRWLTTRGAAKAATHKRAYGGTWRRDSERIRREWVATKGWVCPGWHTIPPHPANDLVVDHDIGVLCRVCNARKAATWDKGRRDGGTPPTGF